METYNNLEFDDMRSQLVLLKEKLNSQDVVNERLLREVMNSKASDIKHEAMWSVVAETFVIVMMIFSFPRLGFSWAFCIATIVFMLVSIGATVYQHRDLNSRTMNGDLLTVAKVMRRLKKNYRDWLKFSIPVIVLWFAWMGYDFYHMAGDKTLTISLMTGAVIGGAIGGFFGYLSYRKVLRTCDEIINSIEGE